jgi:hypothetical protein
MDSSGTRVHYARPWFPKQLKNDECTHKDPWKKGAKEVPLEFDGPAAAGITGSGPSVVLLAAADNVLGDAGVKRAIGAPQQVDEPRLTRWFRPSSAVLSSHPDKILVA